jgi:hypothetical protein
LSGHDPGLMCRLYSILALDLKEFLGEKIWVVKKLQSQRTQQV